MGAEERNRHDDRHKGGEHAHADTKQYRNTADEFNERCYIGEKGWRRKSEPCDGVGKHIHPAKKLIGTTHDKHVGDKEAEHKETGRDAVLGKPSAARGGAFHSTKSLASELFVANLVHLGGFLLTRVRSVLVPLARNFLDIVFSDDWCVAPAFGGVL